MPAPPRQCIEVPTQAINACPWCCLLENVQHSLLSSLYRGSPAFEYWQSRAGLSLWTWLVSSLCCTALKVEHQG